MEEWRRTLHAAAECLCTPALALSDALHFIGFERHGQQHMEWPGMRRSIVCAEHDLIVLIRDVQRRALGVNLDHRPVLVAACRHVRSFQRPEGIALTRHQFGQNLSHMLRLARGYRYVMDHPNSPQLRSYRFEVPRSRSLREYSPVSRLSNTRARLRFTKNAAANVRELAKGCDN